jgi:hypothetical protein
MSNVNRRSRVSSKTECQKPALNLIRDQKQYSLLIFLFFFISACDKGPPIQEEKFIKVYVDLLIVQDSTTAETFSLDSIKTLVFTKHNISSEQYDETINYYNSRPEKWAAFFDSTTAYVERLKLNPEKKP